MNHRKISLESQVNHFTDRLLCIVTRWGCLDRKWQAHNDWQSFQVHKSTPSLLYHMFRVLPRKTECVVDFLCSSGQFLRFTVLKKYPKVPSSLRTLPLGNSYFLNFPPEARMRPHQAADGHSRTMLRNPDQMESQSTTTRTSGILSDYISRSWLNPCLAAMPPNLLICTGLNLTACNTVCVAFCLR
jgi:hypothetical protein